MLRMLKQVAVTGCMCVFTAFLTWHVAIAYKIIQQRQQNQIDVYYAISCVLPDLRH